MQQNKTFVAVVEIHGSRCLWHCRCPCVCVLMKKHITQYNSVVYSCVFESYHIKISESGRNTSGSNDKLAKQGMVVMPTRFDHVSVSVVRKELFLPIAAPPPIYLITSGRRARAKQSFGLNAQKATSQILWGFVWRLSVRILVKTRSWKELVPDTWWLCLPFYFWKCSTGIIYYYKVFKI